MDEHKVAVSIVIPVYGCRAALPELYRRLVSVLEQLGLTFEIIFVDDCCPQDSWSEIREICLVDNRVIGLRLSRNFGQIRAITSGLDTSVGDWVIVMDCDLQDPPEAIADLWTKIHEGWDVVFARRVKRKDTGLTMALSRSFYKTYDWFTDGTYDPTIANFSIASRKVIDSYCSLREQNRGYVTFIRWLGFRQTSIDVESEKRYEGKSSYTMRRKVRMAFELITSQSTKPLKIAVCLGLLLAALAFLYLLFLVIQKYVNPEIAIGWTSMIGAVFLMGGLNLSFIGVVGLYVGNIFEEVKQRPLYVIAETINAKGDG